MLTWIIAPALITLGFIAAIVTTVVAGRRKSDRLHHPPPFDASK